MFQRDFLQNVVASLCSVLKYLGCDFLSVTALLLIADEAAANINRKQRLGPKSTETEKLR